MNLKKRDLEIEEIEEIEEEKRKPKTDIDDHYDRVRSEAFHGRRIYY